MIIPLHLAPNLDEQTLNYSVSGEQLDPSLLPQHQQQVELVSPIIAAPVGSGDLMRFGQLMSDVGLALIPIRMLYDRQYAFDRLAQGYIHGDAELSDLSLSLFQGYQQAGEWLGLAH